MFFDNLERSSKRLEQFFGGKAYIYFEPSNRTYQISVSNDDLINNFQYNFPQEESITQPRIRAELQKMLKKYIKQMEIEQELMRKGKL